MNIFVGNLSYTTTEESLQALFEGYGAVASAKIIKDRDTGRSRGFGFVEMANDDEAQAAVEGLDGRDVDGRALKVNKARPKTEGSGGGGESRERRW